MSNVDISANMSLPVPQVGIDPGPDWANNINSCLSIIDQHNHTPGQGVSIPSAGININADLSFNDNNATMLRSARFQSQVALLSTPTDLGCLYESGVDLYFNDGVGNQVRITQSGGIAGTPGSIANLTPPASASYVSGNQTFVFESNVNTAANLDVGSIVIREVAASANGITLSSPNSLATSYSLTLPTALPSLTSLVQIDTGGNLSYVNPNTLVPPGTISYFSGPSVPSGYLQANGQAVSRTTYANLFSVIGTTYGAGNGTTTFNVPNSLVPFYLAGANSIPSYVQSYWKMGQTTGNEPNFAASGITYDLTEFGTVPSAAGFVSPIGSRGPYSASNTFIVPLGSSPTTPYDSPLFVIGTWFKATAAISQYIISKTDGANGWSMYVDGSGNVNVQFNNSSVGGFVMTSSGIDVNDGNWHLIYFALLAPTGANGAVIYIDNVLSATHVGFSYTGGSRDLQIGAYGPNPSNQPGTNELLTLMEFWDSVPASLAAFAALINQRWNGGAGMDYTAQIAQLYLIKT